jgi:hypothetical protein
MRPEQVPVVEAATSDRCGVATLVVGDCAFVPGVTPFERAEDIVGRNFKQPKEGPGSTAAR